MNYRFVCPGKPVTKGFRHHIYCDLPTVDTDDEISVWLIQNVGRHGETWKVFFHSDESVRSLGGFWSGQHYYGYLFVFKNEQDAMLFKLVWGGNDRV